MSSACSSQSASDQDQWVSLATGRPRPSECDQDKRRYRRGGGDRPTRGATAGRDPFDSTTLELEAMRAEREREAAAIREAIARVREGGRG